MGGFLSPLLAAFFVRLDDALYDLADKATNRRPYTVYFEAMRVIRHQTQVIQGNFLRLLRQGGESAAEGLLECDLLSDSESVSQDLSLTQDGDLEETLAINNLISKAESAYRELLVDMNGYLARLLDRDELDMRSNPYGPFAICHAFRGALDTARQLEPEIRPVIYKVFDKQVMDHLGDYYRQCLTSAAAAGYLPVSGLKPGMSHGDRPDARPGTGDAFRVLQDSEGVTALDPGSAEHSTPVAFETLQDLLLRGRATANAAVDESIVMPTHELLGALTRLGERVLNDDSGVGIPLRAQLASALGSPDEWSCNLERNDRDTLDLVFMFFEHLFAGHALPDPIKVLLGRMQIPIAKLALLDKGFFSLHAHPTRQLLNHIAEAAVGWGEADGRGPDSLYDMIERVAERLILDFDGDPRLFAQMDRFFLAHIAHDQVRIREAEARALAEVRPATGGSAQQAVAAALESALIRYVQVPAVVESILREGWQPVMLAAFQSGGADGPEWRAALDLVDRLLWSVQPKTHSEERRQLLRRIPEILRVLRLRLTARGCDQRLLARWFKDLQTLHLAVLQGDACGGAASATADRASSTMPVLMLGDWIELLRDGGAPARLKLVWRSPDGERLLFVDRQGRPAPELAGLPLSGLIAQDQVRLLGRDHGQLADTAMRALMGRLAAA